MLRRNNKKGFTLAELLIVVAIIAVLVAIAVPLFVSALDKANKARDDANLRAVRGAAVVAILSAEKPMDSTVTESNIFTKNTDGVWELKGDASGKWYAVGTISASGDVTGLTINKTKATAWGTQNKEAVIAQTGGTYKVYVEVTILDLSTTHTTEKGS